MGVSGEPGPAEERLSNVGLVNDVDYSKTKIVYRPSGIGLTSKTAGQKLIAVLRRGGSRKAQRPFSNGQFVSLMNPASPGALGSSGFCFWLAS